MSAEPGGIVEIGSMTITSNTESSEQILDEMAKDAPAEDDPSRAASLLGRRGAEAREAKREAAEKAKAKAEKREAKNADHSVGAESGNAATEPDGDAADGPDGDGAASDTDKRKAEADRRKGNPKHDPTARVQQATREAAEARRERDAERQRAADLERRLQALERTRPGESEPAKAATKADGEPREEDFDSYTDYVKALSRFTVAQERKAQAEDAREEREHVDKLRRLDDFKAAMRSAAEEDPSFPEREWITATIRPSDTMAPDDPRRNHPYTWMADELLHNPGTAPSLALHLSEHKDEFQRIATLSSRAAVIREMAKIVTRLESATTDTSPRPTVSKAKPPVKPVAGSPPTDSGEPDDDAPLSVFIARDNQRRLQASRR